MKKVDTPIEERKKKQLEQRKLAYAGMKLAELNDAYAAIVRYLDRKFENSERPGLCMDGTPYIDDDYNLALAKHNLVVDELDQRLDPIIVTRQCDNIAKRAIDN